MPLLWLVLFVPACVLWDDTPYSTNVAGLSDSDADGTTVLDGDCNDADPDVFPGATDSCDGIDNDCDGEVDEIVPDTVWCQDVDGDHYGDIAHQTRTCFPEDGWVQDCADCDDGDPQVNPGVVETCNGVDDDCDGITDPDGAEGSVHWYAVPAQARYGVLPVPRARPARSPRPRHSLTGALRRRTEAEARCAGPLAQAGEAGAERVAGLAGAGGLRTFRPGGKGGNAVSNVRARPASGVRAYRYADQDGDGYGGAEGGGPSCEPPSGAVSDSTDCDDDAYDTHPGAEEVCNDGRDNNCDGTSNGCGLSGPTTLTDELGALLVGPDVPYEVVGTALGIVDANGDGLDDLVVSSSGGMYGDDTAGAVHVWYGAPTGTRAIADAAGHVVGSADLFLGATSKGSPVMSTAGFDDSDDSLWVGSQGFSTSFDDAGVILELPAGIYGQQTVEEEQMIARGRSSMEGFGTTLSLCDSALDGAPALLVGAPFNSENGTYAGAIYVVDPATPDAVDAVATLRGDEDDFFGGYLSTGSDLDGDGTNDVVVGAIPAGNPAVVVFHGPFSGERRRADADAELRSETIAPQGTMVLPDMDGDGTDDIAIPGVSRLAFVRGTTNGETTPEEGASGYLALDNKEGVVVGYGLALGDPQGDGAVDLAIGIPLLDSPPEHGAALESGAIAVVALDRVYSGSHPLEDVASVMLYSPHGHSNVAFHLAFGDLNADGYDDLAASATGWRSGGAVDAGAVWFILGGGI